MVRREMLVSFLPVVPECNYRQGMLPRKLVLSQRNQLFGEFRRHRFRQFRLTRLATGMHGEKDISCQSSGHDSVRLNASRRCRGAEFLAPFGISSHGKHRTLPDACQVKK